jgi:hypothetical protein
MITKLCEIYSRLPIIAAFLFCLSACAGSGSMQAGLQRPTKGKALQYYDLGMSDAVKRQYWSARNLQMQSKKGEEVAYRTRYYTFNIQPDPQANIARVPYNVTLPILE